MNIQKDLKKRNSIAFSLNPTDGPDLCYRKNGTFYHNKRCVRVCAYFNDEVIGGGSGLQFVIYIHNRRIVINKEDRFSQKVLDFLGVCAYEYQTRLSKRR